MRVDPISLFGDRWKKPWFSWREALNKRKPLFLRLMGHYWFAHMFFFITHLREQAIYVS